jgi:hypothetical protein
MNFLLSKVSVGWSKSVMSLAAEVNKHSTEARCGLIAQEINQLMEQLKRLQLPPI